MFIQDHKMHQSKLSSMMTSVFNECYLVNITTGIDFSITFQSRVEEPKEPNGKPAVKYLMWEARSKGFNSRSLSVAKDQKKPYLWKGLKPDYCQSWTIFEELDSTSDVITAVNSLQNEKSPIPLPVSSVSQQDVSDTHFSGVGSPVLSATSVKLEPDEAGEANKLDSNRNTMSVFTNFTAGVKLDEEAQPDEAKDGDPLSCTSNIVISECDSLSTIKIENILVENDEIYQCDHCQKEFNEFDKLRSHINDHLSENIEPRETPGFNILVGTNDKNFRGGCGIQEQTFSVEFVGVSEIHNSSRPIGSVESRSCRVSAVGGIVNSSTYGQKKQETLVEATGAGYDASDKLVIVDATSSNSVNTVIDTGGILLRCDYCQKQFRELKKLRSHIIVHLNENSRTGAEDKPFRCEFCNKSFLHRSSRVRHIKTHTGEKTFKCEFCGKRFARNSTRNEHVRTHIGKKPFVCKFCDKSFVRNSNLKAHVRTHTGEKPFKCSFCDKSFAEGSSHDRHVRIHTGEKPFTCSICDKRFAQSSAHKVHVATHSGEKRFGCEFCDKRFSQTWNLKAHVRTHTGEKLLSCEYCDRKFAQTRDRDRHIRTHTGEKPFGCDFCDKRFARDTHLNAHVRTHTGEKPFTCEFCDKRFSHTSNLKAHVRTHTREKLFSCEYCDRKFARTHDRDAHSRTHSGEKPLFMRLL